MKRYGQIIKLKPEFADRYKGLHAHPWPEVNSMLNACNVHNYSIYQWGDYLFSYYEYTGKDYEADMQKMKDDPTTQEWWKETDPCQEPVEGACTGEWWTIMNEVYHLD